MAATVNELRQRFALDTAGGMILGLGVDAPNCTVSVTLPGGPADPSRFQGDKLEVGDTILSVEGELATPDNINELLRAPPNADKHSPARIKIRARKAMKPDASALVLTPRRAESRINESFKLLTGQASIGSQDDSKEIEVTMQRGAAGTFMRFTSLVKSLGDIKELQNLSETGGMDESQSSRLKALIPESYEQLLRTIEQTSRAETTLFAHIDALVRALLYICHEHLRS